MSNAKELEYVDAELVCPKCGKRVTVTLYFSKKGIAKANKYYCGCACVLMDVEFNNGTEEVDQSSD
jgi:transcription elongation factor Elf1